MAGGSQMKSKAVLSLAAHAADRSSDVRSDFLAAFDRLKSGKASTVKLGPREQIRPAAVAREAGRARSQLYATHSDILVMIDEENERRKGKQNSRAKGEWEIDVLRALNKQLLAEKELLARENYQLLHRIRELEAGGN